MMMLPRLKITCIILILAAAGCTDDNVLKLPVQTKVVMRFLPLDQGIYGEFEEVGIHGSMCRIGIQSIAFEGMREVGDDVFFNMEPGIDLLINDFINSRADITDFELPQGIYNNIRLDYHLQTINHEEWIPADESVTQEIGLIIEGEVYHYWWNSDPFMIDSLHLFPFVFMIDRTEQFLFRSTQDAVVKQPDCQILLLFDLDKAFQSIDPNSFEEAEISGDEDHPKIIISSKKNRDLYEILLYRLGMSTRMIVH